MFHKNFPASILTTRGDVVKEVPKEKQFDPPPNTTTSKKFPSVATTWLVWPRKWRGIPLWCSATRPNSVHVSMETIARSDLGSVARTTPPTTRSSFCSGDFLMWEEWEYLASIPEITCLKLKKLKIIFLTTYLQNMK